MIEKGLATTASYFGTTGCMSAPQTCIHSALWSSLWLALFLQWEVFCSHNTCPEVQGHRRHRKPASEWRFTEYLSSLVCCCQLSLLIYRRGYASLVLSLLINVNVEPLLVIFSCSLLVSVLCVPWLSWSHLYTLRWHPCILPRPCVLKTSKETWKVSFLSWFRSWLREARNNRKWPNIDNLVIQDPAERFGSS